MLKFTKFDLEPKWIDPYICFCGGGSGENDGPGPDTTNETGNQSSAPGATAGNMGPGGGQGSNSAASSGASSSSSSSSSGGGMNEGQDNTGIADAAGYGSGSSDTSSSDGGMNEGQDNTGISDAAGINDAVSDALDAAVSDAIGDYSADDTSTDLADVIGEDTTAQEAVNAGFVTSELTGKPIGTSVPGSYVTQENATPDEIAAAYAALSGLPGTAEYAAAQEAQAAQLAADQELGFMSDVLDDLDTPTEEEIAASQVDDIFSYGPMSSGYQTTAQMEAALNSQFGGLPSAPSVSSNIDPNYSPSTVAQLSNMYGIDYGLLDAAVDDDFADIGNRPGPGVEGPGTGYTDQGLPVGLEFATNPQTGAQITTNLAGLTEQQQANQPFSMDVAQFIGSSPYGYEIDPATGNPIGQVGTAPFGILGALTTGLQQLFNGPPENVEDLIEQGAYTGMTGQDNDGIGAGGGEGGNVMQQATQVDPCPPGYEMDPATNQCVPIDVVTSSPFQLGKRQYAPTEMPSLLGTPVGPFQSQLRPTTPDMSFMRPAVNPFGFARGGIVELPKR
jgi:hypothetical protein